ncbi:hypothetical protein [Archaeoglobus sp.]
MPLILVSKLYHEPLSKDVRERYGVSSFCLVIPKKYLSDYYMLETGSKIEGEITSVEPSIPEIEGLPVSFVLFVQPIGTNDYIYFYEDSWRKLADYGLIPDETVMKVKLVKANGKTIFAKRDVKVDLVWMV